MILQVAQMLVPLRGLGGFPLRCGGTNVVITIACDNIPMVNCIGTSS